MNKNKREVEWRRSWEQSAHPLLPFAAFPLLALLRHTGRMRKKETTKGGGEAERDGEFEI